MNTSLKFHHLGLAAKKDKAAILFLSYLNYEIGNEIYDPEQNVYLRMCVSQNDPDVELVTPGKGDGPLTPILKTSNELIYHTCYEVENIQESKVDMTASGLRIIEVSQPKPAILFNNRLVSFYHVLGFGLIELLQS